MTEATTRTERVDLDERLNNIDYHYLTTEYKPSLFAFKFINFIKLVNGSSGEENKSPIIHYDMLDQVGRADRASGGSQKRFFQNLFVSFRGSAKTTALHEYMILYLATYGEIDGFGKVSVGAKQ